MSGIKRFEDIQAWQEARKLTSAIHRAIGASEAFSRNFGLRDQIQSASVSIMANIAEGFDASSDAEFIRFLSYALRSASEVQSHLYVALDQQYLQPTQFQKLYDQAASTKNLVLGFIRYLRRSPKS